MSGLVWALIIFAQMPDAPPSSWERIGLVTFLILALTVGGTLFMTERIVPGKRLRDTEADCERLREELKQEKESSAAMMKDWMADVRRTQSIAEAYIAVREHDDGK